MGRKSTAPAAQTGLTGREKVRIIALTASAFDADRERCLEAGMDDHLAKPVGTEVLYGMLLKWLRSSETETRAAASAAG